MLEAAFVAAAVVIVLIVLTAMRTVRIVPQARARNVERLGRYRKTLEPGMNFILPFIDRVKPLIDLREQVVSFLGQPVITEDNLVVRIDTVLFFQVTDPRAADYEIVDYIQAIEQLTATMLRSVIGSMDLEVTLTSRDKINTMLRGVLDDASGKWGIRVTRVEIKAIDPPKSVIDAMEKQMRAEREKRAAILTAEGLRQSQILTAEGDKQGTILRAEGDKQSAILRSEGQAAAIGTVFQSIHDGDPDPKLLAYQYLQTLPQLAQGAGSTMWMIPSELTSALKAISSAFDGSAGAAAGSGTRQAAGGAAGRDPARPAAGSGTDADRGAHRAQLAAADVLAQVPLPGVPGQLASPAGAAPGPDSADGVNGGAANGGGVNGGPSQGRPATPLIPGQPGPVEPAGPDQPAAPDQPAGESRIARPTVSSAPNASCSRPVCPSAAIRPGPAAPARTRRSGGTANGTAMSATRASGAAGARATATANGTSTHAAYSSRVRLSPSTTARVRLPVTRSVGMSRRLLMTSSAQASSPIGAAAATVRGVSERICTYAVPATAARPKNKNTETSPSARYPYGRLPPV